MNFELFKVNDVENIITIKNKFYEVEIDFIKNDLIKILDRFKSEKWYSEKIRQSIIESYSTGIKHLHNNTVSILEKDLKLNYSMARYEDIEWGIEMICDICNEIFTEVKRFENEHRCRLREYGELVCENCLQCEIEKMAENFYSTDSYSVSDFKHQQSEYMKLK